MTLTCFWFFFCYINLNHSVWTHTHTHYIFRWFFVHGKTNFTYKLYWSTYLFIYLFLFMVIILLLHKRKIFIFYYFFFSLIYHTGKSTTLLHTITTQHWIHIYLYIYIYTSIECGLGCCVFCGTKQRTRRCGIVFINNYRS